MVLEHPVEEGEVAGEHFDEADDAEVLGEVVAADVGEHDFYLQDGF